MFRDILMVIGIAALCGALSFLEGLAGVLGLSRAKLRVLAVDGGRATALFLRLSKHAQTFGLAVRVFWLLTALALFAYMAERFQSVEAALVVFGLAAVMTVAGLWLSRTDWAARLFVPEGGEGGDATEREIRLLIDEDDAEDSTIDETEKTMIRNIFEFDNKTAEDVAVHRRDVVMLNVTATWEEIIQTAVTERFSRIPIYEGNIDNIIGVLHIKDLFHHMAEGGGNFDLRASARKPYFVPQTKKTDELFQDMRRHKAHMAIIVDEYGGTAGLVTLENLIEEIMGSIYDEDDEEDAPLVTHIYDNAYEVDGKTPLDSLAERFSADLPIDEYDTVSGYIIGHLGRIPTMSERPAFADGGLLFKAFHVEDNRVTKAIVCEVSDASAETAEGTT